MPCLSLGLRFPARRAWKIFTSKLQKKLPIFRLSKPRNSHRILGATGRRPSNTYTVQYKSRKKQNRRHPPPRRFEFKKRQAPVFVDKLYYDEGGVLQPSGVEKFVNFVDRSAAVSEGAEASNGVGADDMWESLAMASPHMDEIDDRAEEFIAKFRAEMLHQESMAKESTL